MMDEGENAMRTRFGLILFTISVIAVLILSGCLGKEEAPVAVDIDLAYTQAAQTIVAELTQNAPPVTEAPAEVQVFEPTPTETFPPTSTPVPTETPAPTHTLAPMEPSPLLSETPALTGTVAEAYPPEIDFTLAFEDDFSFALGWPTGDDSAVQLRYFRGGYAIKNKVARDVVWSTRSQQFVDMRVEVTASRVSGDLEGYYGVVCRFANGSNYYMLGVSSDGSYMIGKRKAGNLTFLIEGKDESSSVYTGNTPNIIRADCIGNTLSLYANGVLLASVEDDEFTGGAAGLAVGTRRNPGFEAFFDDFKVYIPE